MRASIHLGRIGGIRVGLNWSLLPIAVLFAWSLASGQLPYEVGGYPHAAYWLAAVVTTAAFFACLLAHELSHAVVARRRHLQVDSIVLWLLGGMAQMQTEPDDPGTELRVSMAGPAMSLFVAVALGLSAWAFHELAISPLVVASVAWLAGINALLGFFNLLPALPLDGGRVLRALLWRHWGDRARATNAAAGTARVIGGALIGLGAAELLLQGSFEGAWIALIGWFIFAVAGQQQQRVAVGDRLGRPRVADAMSGPPVSVPASANLSDVFNHHLRSYGFSSFPVVDELGALVGLLTVERMNRVPGERWWLTNVLEASVPATEIVACGPNDPLDEVAARLSRSPDHVAVVVDAGRPVGILSGQEADTILQRMALLRQALAGVAP